MVTYGVWWRRKWQPTPVSLPGESPRQRNLASNSPWVLRFGQDWSNLAPGVWRKGLGNGSPLPMPCPARAASLVAWGAVCGLRAWPGRVRASFGRALGIDLARARPGSMPCGPAGWLVQAHALQLLPQSPCPRACSRREDGMGPSPSSVPG